MARWVPAGASKCKGPGHRPAGQRFAGRSRKSRSTRPREARSPAFPWKPPGRGGARHAVEDDFTVKPNCCYPTVATTTAREAGCPGYRLRMSLALSTGFEPGQHSGESSGLQSGVREKRSTPRPGVPLVLFLALTVSRTVCLITGPLGCLLGI